VESKTVKMVVKNLLSADNQRRSEDQERLKFSNFQLQNSIDREVI